MMQKPDNTVVINRCKSKLYIRYNNITWSKKSMRHYKLVVGEEFQIDSDSFSSAFTERVRILYEK